MFSFQYCSSCVCTGVKHRVSISAASEPLKPLESAVCMRLSVESYPCRDLSQNSWLHGVSYVIMGLYQSCCQKAVQLSSASLMIGQLCLDWQLRTWSEEALLWSHESRAEEVHIPADQLGPPLTEDNSAEHLQSGVDSFTTESNNHAAEDHMHTHATSTTTMTGPCCHMITPHNTIQYVNI